MGVCMCVCVCVCMQVCMHMQACTCVCARVLPHILPIQVYTTHYTHLFLVTYTQVTVMIMHQFILSRGDSIITTVDVVSIVCRLQRIINQLQ